jgi:hypothetical protein
VSDQLDTLLDTLLWEGYALYPYTPGATKNATPTPFGIVYPPAYAAELATTYDHLELRCVLRGPPDAVLRAEVHLLAPGGGGHRAQPRMLELPGAMAAALNDRPARTELSVPCPGASPLAVGMTLATHADPAAEDAYEVVLRVENRTLTPGGLDRAGALERSLLSTHPVLHVAGGRFVSALERPGSSVNTFPVLAADDDTVMLGAAIVLPDHPRIAPESRGGLFDGTEIEEALLLHVHVLADAERAEIAGADPAVRDMIARAAAATPEDILALHGRVTVRDPVTLRPPAEPADLPDPHLGQSSADIDGRTFRRGAPVIIRARAAADLEARMLDGRRATIQRIVTDYDGRIHLGVTIDDDPGAELMRQTGRLRYFFAPEVEVLES